MKIYISGGCKNGKTSFAQNAALKLAGICGAEGLNAYGRISGTDKKSRRKIYVATMIPGDAEDMDRIRRHIENRAGLGFETRECSRDISGLLIKEGPDCVYLVDSITALVQNAMFPPYNYTEKALSEAKQPFFGSPEHIKQMRKAAFDLKNDLLYFAEHTEDAVFVSDFIYSEAARYDNLTLEYMKTLADIDRALAGKCDTLIELCTGNVIIHKGEF